MAAHLRLGVNIDHVATIRNARGGRHPDPMRAAKLAIEAGADGITAHLREDRRHISDDDIARLNEIAEAYELYRTLRTDQVCCTGCLRMMIEVFDRSGDAARRDACSSRLTEIDANRPKE